MPFGISSAPEIYLRIMENILVDIPGVCVYLHDVLVSGTSQSDHLRNLQVVLEKI